jgi:hypothetical protein
MRFLLLSLLLVSTTFAQISEVKVNVQLIDGTSGEGPGTADTVQLVRLGQGMEILITEGNVRGTTSLEVTADMGKKFKETDQLMVQAVKGRTVYSKMVTSLDIPVEITVFDAAEEAAVNARVGSLAVYVQPDQMDIGQFYNIDNVNSPPVTLETDVTFRFPLMDGAKIVEVSSRRGTMPVKQTMQRDGDDGTISYPLRPGRTQIFVRNVFPYHTEHAETVTVPLLPEQEFFHILAVPSTLKIEGQGVEFVETDDKQDVSLFEFTREPNQAELVLTVSGAPADPDQANAAMNQTQQGERKFEAMPNAKHGYRWFIVGGVALVLLGLTPLGMRR